MTTDFRWTDRAVREALGLEPRPDAESLAFRRVWTDTRTVMGGDLFVALRGERFDGHEFVPEAVRKGARAAVVSRVPEVEDPVEFYLVDDTLQGLGDLARYRRRALPARVVGITGSSGKTTVKELLSAALRPSHRVHATRGNLNNRVGLPICMLEAPADADFLVLEMGTSEPGEIALLSSIAEPDHAIVTTVSEAHLTGLGSLAGVLDEKLDLVRRTGGKGSVVVGDRPEELPVTAREIRPDVHVAGLSERADPEFRGRPHDQDVDGTYQVRFWGRDVKSGLPGLHGVRNLLLALACARLLGSDEDAAIEGACGVRPGPLRGEVQVIGRLTMILDCYNANPQSLDAALDLLAGLPVSSRKVAVLGSMLELGERSYDLHRGALERARALPLDLLVATGEFAAAASEIEAAAPSPQGTGPELVVSRTLEGAYRALRSRLRGTETVLLKGSRGVALEGLIPLFEEDFGVGGGGTSATVAAAADPVERA